MGSEEESGGSPFNNSRDKKHKTAHFAESSGSAGADLPPPSHNKEQLVGVPHKRGYNMISTAGAVDDDIAIAADDENGKKQ